MLKGWIDCCTLENKLMNETFVQALFQNFALL